MNYTEELEERIMDLVGGLPEMKKHKLMSMLEDLYQGQSRGESRTSCHIPVDINWRNRIYREFVCNVSSRGAYIFTREAFGPGHQVTLAFSSPRGTHHYRTAGVVIRKDVDGIAVKFNQQIEMDQSERSRDDHPPLIQIVKSQMP